MPSGGKYRGTAGVWVTMRFLLTIVAAATVMLGAAGSASAAGPSYTFESRQTGGVMSVTGAWQGAGAPVVDWPYHGGSHQRWTPGTTTTVGTKHYSTLIAGHSGDCLDAPTPYFGTRIVQNPCNGSLGQQWRIEPAGGWQVNSFYRFIPRNVEDKGLVAVVSQWNPGPGQELVLAFKGNVDSKPQHFFLNTF
jgi:hypothetical protein